MSDVVSHQKLLAASQIDLGIERHVIAEIDLRTFDGAATAFLLPVDPGC